MSKTKEQTTKETEQDQKDSRRPPRPPASVGRIVHYYDREEVVNAAQQKRNPEPFPAIITRVHRDQDGRPTDIVNLHVFDPEVGVQVKHDVHLGEQLTPNAGQWYWPHHVMFPPAAPPADAAL